MRAFITLIDASGHVILENKEIKPSYTETVYNPKDMLYEVYNKFQFSYSERMTREKYKYLKALESVSHLKGRPCEACDCHTEKRLQ